MLTAAEALADHFDCQIPTVQFYLEPPTDDNNNYREEAIAFLKGKKLRTHYRSKRTKRLHLQPLRCDGLTADNADGMYAYEGILNISVRQHFFAVHRIYLEHWRLPCLEVKHKNGHSSYYPLELIEVLN